MRCLKCGGELTTDVGLCPKCGVQIGANGRQARGAAESSGSRTYAEQRCAACGKAFFSELSVGGHCEICGEAICTACWSVERLRMCRVHSGVSERSPRRESARKTSPAKQSAIAEMPIDQRIDALRKEGLTVVTPDQAHTLEANFIRGFDQRVEQIDLVADPVSGRKIRISEARARHAQDAEAASANEPQNRTSRFIFRTGGWGRPKAAVIVEAQSHCRLETLKFQGYDDQPMSRTELSAILNKLAGEKKRKPFAGAFRVVILGSTTGFTADAMALVDDPARSDRFHDKQIAIVLGDMHEGQAYYDQSDSRLDCFLPVIDPHRWETACGEIAEGVRAILAQQNSITVSQAAASLKVSEAWILSAFLQMGGKGYKLDYLNDMGWVLSTHS